MKSPTLVKALAVSASSLVLLAACGKPGSDAGGADSGKGGKSVEIHLVTATGVGESIGSIKLREADDGVEFQPSLTGLPPGSHGFHVHQNPDCGPSEKDGQVVAAGAAGEHLDPAGTGQHAGPEGAGHLGDLPPLQVTPTGKANTALKAPRLKLADLAGRALVIHADPDDFAGSPGGARIACGVIGA